MQPADTTTKVTAEAAADAGAENVRLVVWDLDETFWRGTLTEGGIEYQRAAHDIVIELARRGIISSICSKNTLEDVQAILTREGLWDYFVFPSINWEPKGARLAALVAEVRCIGEPLADDTFAPSDLVVPFPDASLAETRGLLADSTDPAGADDR